jgi:hypothetical protein
MSKSKRFLFCYEHTLHSNTHRSKQVEKVAEEVVNTATDESAEENEPSYEEIDKLVQAGINAADIAKLKAGGVNTVRGFALIFRDSS